MEKRCNGAGLIVTKLEETSIASISLILSSGLPVFPAVSAFSDCALFAALNLYHFNYTRGEQKINLESAALLCYVRNAKKFVTIFFKPAISITAGPEGPYPSQTCREAGPEGGC